MRACRGEQRIDALSMLLELGGGERLEGRVIQTEEITGEAQPDRPHSGAAAFENTRQGVIDFHTGGDVADAQRDHIGHRLGWARSPSEQVIGRDHMIGPIAGHGGHGHDMIHHLPGISRSGTDFKSGLAQVLDCGQCPGNEGAVLADIGDLQRHEPLVDGCHVSIAGSSREALLETRSDLWLIAQAADVVPLAHAHGASGFFEAQLDIECGEGLDKDSSRRERAEIDDGASPVENGRLQPYGGSIVHQGLRRSVGWGALAPGL